MNLAEQEPKAAPDDQRQALRAEQLRLLFETQLSNVSATFAIAVIVVAVLAPISDRFLIFTWCVFLFMASASRVLLAFAWRRDERRLQRTQYWWRLMLLATLLGGAGWGAGNLLLFPARSLPQQMLFVFITCGISAAAAVSLAADRRIAWSFIIPCALPLEIRLYQYSGDLGPSFAIMGFIYLIFMAGVISRHHRYVRDNILLRFAEQERERLHAAFAQALHSSQEKLQALFDLSPLGCILMRADGSLVEANRSFQRMLGCGDGEDFKNYFGVSFNRSGYSQENWQGWQQFVKKGGVETLECELMRKDGRLMQACVHRMVVDTGDGQHFAWALVEDITERRSHEQQLQALNNRLSLATQAGHIGVWEMDLARNTLYWDDRMCEVYGIDIALRPATLEMGAALVHPDDWDKVRAAMGVAMADPQADRYVVEYRTLLADGTQHWVRAAGLLQRDEDGVVHRIIGVAWNITELKRVARMKSEFVSTVSHELRTPLTSIRGSLGLLARGVAGELSPTAQEFIDIAFKNSERLSLLIDDLLDIEKIESGKMHLDLHAQALQALLEQAIAANQGYAHNFSVLLTLISNTEAIVTVDANRFMQVMANLISNAVKFSNAGDSVEIAAMDTPAKIRIEVRDRGPGIPIEFRERIFLRFSQADASDTRARSGSGLGLAITKTLVEKMRGDIGFADRDGGGTVFFLEFPRADAHDE